DGTGVHHHVVDAAVLQGAMQPEAIAAGLVAGADARVGGKLEPCLGLNDLLSETVEVTRGHSAQARLLGGLRGAGEYPLVLAELQSDVQGPGRGHGQISV